MDYIYVTVGMFVGIVALFKRELLVEKASFKIILAISAALFLAGLGLHFIEADPGSFSGALLAPLMSLGLYRLFRRLFFLWVRREPVDTYLNWTPSLGADRLFNIVYFGAAISIEILIMGGMMGLAKAGW